MCIILMSPTLTHYHIDHSRLLLFICKLPLQWWENWFIPSDVPWLSCSAPVYMHGRIRMLTRTPVGNVFVRERAQCLHVVSYAFSLISIHFQSYSGQYIPPTPFSEALSYICHNIVLPAGIPSWDPVTFYMMSFLNLQTIKVYCLDGTALWVLTNACHVSIIIVFHRIVLPP